MYNDRDLEKLLGLTITSIEGVFVGSECVIFNTKEGRTFKMYHEQDCCESVSFSEAQGEIEDLIGFPIVLAERVAEEDTSGNYESASWTFYRIATERGLVVFRWHGDSNGYYSEEAHFSEVN